MVTGVGVLQIDHVELFVPDRHEAAGWYQRILGLEIVAEYQEWAADRAGPLMLSSDGGHTKLALFEGSPQSSKPTAGFHRVAFRANANDFVDFLRQLTDRSLTDHQGRPVTADSGCRPQEGVLGSTFPIRTDIAWSSPTLRGSEATREALILIGWAT